MTDRTDDVTERSDPVLVRPYITTGDDDPDAEGEAETWPATATLPEAEAPTRPSSQQTADTAAQPKADMAAQPKDGTAAQPKTDTANQTAGDTANQPAVDGADQLAGGTAMRPAAGTGAGDDTVVQPVVAPAAPRSASIRWAPRLLVLVVGVAVALGIAAYFVRGGGSHDDARRGPSASLPAVNPPTLTGGRSVPASARASSSPSRAASSSPSAAISGSRSLLPPGTRPASSVPAVGPTLAAPPATDHTGRVTSAGGRCLVLGGLLGLDGSPIQVMNCVGGSTQQFTLATDGTLRVAGHCAAATGDASVRSTGCDGAGPSGQWRAGPGGSLVNPSTGECLTDPGRTGATTSVAACAGGDTQRWTLP